MLNLLLTDVLLRWEAVILHRVLMLETQFQFRCPLQKNCMVEHLLPFVTFLVKYHSLCSDRLHLPAVRFHPYYMAILINKCLRFSNCLTVVLFSFKIIMEKH